MPYPWYVCAFVQWFWFQRALFSGSSFLLYALSRVTVPESLENSMALTSPTMDRQVKAMTSGQILSSCNERVSLDALARNQEFQIIMSSIKDMVFARFKAFQVPVWVMFSKLTDFDSSPDTHLMNHELLWNFILNLSFIATLLLSQFSFSRLT